MEKGVGQNKRKQKEAVFRRLKDDMLTKYQIGYFQD